MEVLASGVVRSIPDEGVVLIDQDFEADVLVSLEVEQSAFDVALRWEGPTGEVLWEIDGWTGPEGTERLLAVTDQAGRYRVVLTAWAPPMINGRARVHSAWTRLATAEDRDRSEAERALWTGITMRRDGRLNRASEFLAIASKTYGSLGDRHREADALYQWGLAMRSLARSQGRDDRASLRRRETLRSQAIHLYEGARARYLEAQDLFQEAACWEGIGRVEDDRNQPERAISAFEKAIPLREKGIDPYPLAVAHQILGELYGEIGELRKASEAFLRAIEALDSAPIDDDLLRIIANSWNSRAGVLLILRDLPGASIALDKALGAWEEMKNTKEEELAAGLSKGIVIAALNGDFEAAEEYRSRAEALAQTKHLKALIAHDSGILAYHRQDFDLALKLVAAARSEFDLPWARAQAVQSNAYIQMARGEPDAALEDFRISAEAFEKVGDHWKALVSRIGEAEALVHLRNLDLAFARLEPILTEVEGQRREILDAQLQSSFFAARQRPFELATQILMERGLKNPASGLREKAFDLVERSRGRVLGDLIVAAEIESEARKKEGTEQGQLVHRLTEGLQVQRSTQSRDAANMRVALERLSSLRKHRLEQSPSYQASGLRNPITLGALVEELPNDLVVLMYELGEGASYGWAVTHEGLCAAARLPPRSEIEEQARALADSLLEPAQAEVQAHRNRLGSSLSEALLAPLAACLGEDSRLLLLVEGELERIPFGFLPLPNSDDRLLEKHPVTRVQSVTAWLALQRRARERPASSRVLLIGDPAFSDATERLVGTRREITGILPYLPADKRHVVALGSDARPELFQSASAARAEIWHFASHIEIDSMEPELSRIRLAGNQDLADLYAWQLHRLRMSPNLVVLSGCEGSLGRQFAGEGFIGLTHTFLLAGSTQVIGGLWKVDDGASAALMTKFYKHFANDTTPEEALRQAKLEMAASDGYLSEPYYWAGFVVTGTSAH